MSNLRPNLCSTSPAKGKVPIWVKYSRTGQKAIDNQTNIKPGFQFLQYFDKSLSFSFDQHLKGKLILVFVQMLFLSIFRALCLRVAKLDTVIVPRNQMFPVDFKINWTKVKVNPLVFVQILYGQYLLFPLHDKWLT